MFITGPDVVKPGTGEEVTLEELGGAMAHASKSGVSTFVGEDEEAVLEEVRYLLSFLPSNNLEVPPHVAPADDPMRETPELRELMPASRSAEHTSELQSLMRISYAVFFLKKKKKKQAS